MSRRSAAPALALVASIGASCAYNVRFEDCAVRCDSIGTACPDGLSCGTEGLCRAAGTSGTCSMILGDAGVDAPVQQILSCEGLAATCGPSGNDSCCDTAMPIPGGTYYRSYDVASDAMFPDMSFPATVSPFVLDKYEVTVGRFRKFVEAGMGTQASPPASGAGARELNGSTNQGGWDPAWNQELTTALGSALKCDASYETWTDSAGSKEDLPIDCVTWYEAFAFCTWDGGFLATEAEWNYAASGGSEQRAYPWSNPAGSTTIDCSEANFGGSNYPSTACVPAGTSTVGNTAPNGDALWGQSDMGGNILEWTLDWFAGYAVPCTDCASLVPGTTRVLRGSDLAGVAASLRNGFRRGDVAPSTRFGGVGVRCARSAP